MKSLLIILPILLFTSVGFAQKYHPTVQAVRDTVEKWNDGHRKMDARAMSLTVTDELDSVDRFGEKLTFYSREEYQKMWDWTFRNVETSKKPQVEREVDTVRFVTDDVAIVHASGRIYPEGSKIPLTVEISTFVLIKKDDVWWITAHTVQNRSTDPRQTTSK